MPERQPSVRPLGGAYVFLGSVGARGIHQLGPALQISIPNGSTSVELLRRRPNQGLDLRVTFQTYL
jgi:hypothetical protein